MVGTFKNIEEAQKFFTNDRFAMEMGTRIVALSSEECVCEMELEERHKNATGGVMGGAIFTLGDLAFAGLANQIHMPTVAQSATINFLSVPKASPLRAWASLIKDGRSNTIVEVDIADNNDLKVAKYIVTGFKL